MQHLVRRVRRDDLRAAIVTEILERARKAVKARTTPTQVLAVDERIELRRLVTPTFLRWIERSIDRALRSAHLELIDPGQAHLRVPDAFPRVDLMPGSVWIPEEDMDLGVASYLDGPPEAWWAVTAREVASLAAELRRARNEGLKGFDADEDDLDPLRALVLSPGPGAFSRAVAALRPAHWIEITEVGSELGPTSFSFAERSPGLPPRTKPFDVVVWPVPTPAVGGAANHGRIYRGGHHVGALDSIGPKKWRARVGDALSSLHEAIVSEGLAVLRLPQGYRVERGYVEVPTLLEGLLDDVQLRLTRTINDRPEGRVNQPFVGSSRCSWRTFFLRKSA
jgi:hypothetical protein